MFYTYSPVTPIQPIRLTTTSAVEINRREQCINTCLGTSCHGSKCSVFWSVASCSPTGIYSIWLLINFSSVCFSLSRWLSLEYRVDIRNFDLFVYCFSKTTLQVSNNQRKSRQWNENTIFQHSKRSNQLFPANRYWSELRCWWKYHARNRQTSIMLALISIHITSKFNIHQYYFKFWPLGLYEKESVPLKKCEHNFCNTKWNLLNLIESVSEDFPSDSYEIHFLLIWIYQNIFFFK